jgi:hypothetical protein
MKNWCITAWRPKEVLIRQLEKVLGQVEETEVTLSTSTMIS